MFLRDEKILNNEKINDRYYLMEVSFKEGIEHIKAGQFFMIKSENKDEILRRPISVFDIDNIKGSVKFYYEIKGSGTLGFSKLKTGENINIQGPLGNGFNVDIKDKLCVVVGGGIGIAPLKYLIEKLRKDNRVIAILGGRDRDIFTPFDELNEKIETIYVTDDGSLGIKGNVMDILPEILDRDEIDCIKTCGPEIMMERVAKLSEEKGIECEVSLEARMGCGVNACVGCSIKTKVGMKRVCHDGPVFNSKIIEWER